MKNAALALICTSALAGCLSYTPLYKVGVSTQEANVTRAQCNSFAANTVPVMMVRDWIPIYGANGRIVGHRVEYYDVNEGRRHSAVENCLKEQGYERVSIPFCKDEQIAGRSYKPLTTSPPITSSICAIRQQGGGRILIDLNQLSG